MAANRLGLINGKTPCAALVQTQNYQPNPSAEPVRIGTKLMKDRSQTQLCTRLIRVSSPYKKRKVKKWRYCMLRAKLRLLSAKRVRSLPKQKRKLSKARTTGKSKKKSVANRLSAQSIFEVH